MVSTFLFNLAKQFILPCWRNVLKPIPFSSAYSLEVTIRFCVEKMGDSVNEGGMLRRYEQDRGFVGVVGALILFVSSREKLCTHFKCIMRYILLQQR